MIEHHALTRCAAALAALALAALPALAAPQAADAVTVSQFEDYMENTVGSTIYDDCASQTEGPKGLPSGWTGCEGAYYDGGNGTALLYTFAQPVTVEQIQANLADSTYGTQIVLSYGVETINEDDEGGEALYTTGDGNVLWIMHFDSMDKARQLAAALGYGSAAASQPSSAAPSAAATQQGGAAPQPATTDPADASTDTPNITIVTAEPEEDESRTPLIVGIAVAAVVVAVVIAVVVTRSNGGKQAAPAGYAPGYQPYGQPVQPGGMPYPQAQQPSYPQSPYQQGAAPQTPRAAPTSSSPTRGSRDIRRGERRSIHRTPTSRAAPTGSEEARNTAWSKHSSQSSCSSWSSPWPRRTGARARRRGRTGSPCRASSSTTSRPP